MMDPQTPLKSVRKKQSKSKTKSKSKSDQKRDPSSESAEPASAPSAVPDDKTQRFRQLFRRLRGRKKSSKKSDNSKSRAEVKPRRKKSTLSDIPGQAVKSQSDSLIHREKAMELRKEAETPATSKGSKEGKDIKDGKDSKPVKSKEAKEKKPKSNSDNSVEKNENKEVPKRKKGSSSGTKTPAKLKPVPKTRRHLPEGVAERADAPSLVTTVFENVELNNPALGRISKHDLRWKDKEPGEASNAPPTPERQKKLKKLERTAADLIEADEKPRPKTKKDTPERADADDKPRTKPKKDLGNIPERADADSLKATIYDNSLEAQPALGRIVKHEMVWKDKDTRQKPRQVETKKQQDPQYNIFEDQTQEAPTTEHAADDEGDDVQDVVPDMDQTQDDTNVQKAEARRDNESTIRLDLPEFKAAERLLLLLKRNNLLEHVLKPDENRRVRVLFENGIANFNDDDIEMIARALDSGMDKVLFRPDLVDEMIDDGVKELIKNPEEARQQLLDALLVHEEWLPLNWGGRNVIPPLLTTNTAEKRRRKPMFPKTSTSSSASPATSTGTYSATPTSGRTPTSIGTPYTTRTPASASSSSSSQGPSKKPPVDPSVYL